MIYVFVQEVKLYLHICAYYVKYGCENNRVYNISLVNKNEKVSNTYV